MKTTSYYKLYKPEGTDPVDIEVLNSNFDTIDSALNDLSGEERDSSDDRAYFTVASTRSNIASGETLSTIFGKIMRYFTDLSGAAYCAVANNDSTTAEGSVADARIVNVHGDEIDTLDTQLNGLYFGTDTSGNWGYKTSSSGSVTAFRNPTGDATAADVLSGKIFSSASLENATGTMTNNGTYQYASTASEVVSLEGYYEEGSYVDTSGAYEAGYNANTNSGYDTGYEAGYADGVDSVTLTVVSLGTASGSASFSCTSISGYSSLTASNFALYVTGVSASGAAVNVSADYPLFGSVSASCSPSLSYSASSGKVTVSGMSAYSSAYSTNSTWYRYVSATVSAKVYCYYVA